MEHNANFQNTFQQCLKCMKCFTNQLSLAEAELLQGELLQDFEAVEAAAEIVDVQELIVNEVVEES